MVFTTEEKWTIFQEWIRNNRCFNRTCSSCKAGVCEDINGIRGCATHKK